MNTKQIGLALALLVFSSISVLADVKYVDCNKVGGGNTGADWENAWTNLLTALDDGSPEFAQDFVSADGD